MKYWFKTIKQLFFSTCLLIGFGSTVKSQIEIKGYIQQAKDSLPIGFVSVTLNKANSNSIVNYTLADERGQFFMTENLAIGAYDIIARHLLYEPDTVQVLIAENSHQKVNVSFYMVEKNNELESVIVKARQPIVVKKDTTIYNIEHWTKTNDQSLEQVLGKIPGIKIQANGEIVVDGKAVDKVLIDGEEVTDAGAGILTKSLDPTQIDNVEVRFKEQNDKLKDDLLDTGDFVVLDIKLKQELKKAWFGKARATAGYLNKPQLGGYANVFSLKKIFKAHAFAEKDDFGEQTISLKYIRNLGREAFEKLFELPSDFQTLTEKEAYNSEIFGFDNGFDSYNRNVAGFTSRLTVNDELSVLVGTYNAFDKLLKSRRYDQQFNYANTNSFSENSKEKLTSSKNKVELKYDKSNLKARFDVNLVYSKPDRAFTNSATESLTDHAFSTNEKGTNWYTNLLLQKKFSSKLGIELKSSFANTVINKQSALRHNNLGYTSFLKDDAGNAVFHFGQNEDINITTFFIQPLLQINAKMGEIGLSSLYESHRLKYASQASNRENDIALTSYNQLLKAESTRTIRPEISHSFQMANFTFSNKAGIAFLQYPIYIAETAKKTGGNYSFNGAYSLRNMEISLGYNNRLASFPLMKRILADKLLNFQSIQTKAQSVEPVRERVINAGVYRKFDALNLTADINFLTGKANNLNTISSDINNPFIIQQTDQLESNYQIYSLIFTKSFDKSALKIILEPEALINTNQNLSGNSTYKTTTRRWLLGLKLRDDDVQKRLNYFIYPKYTIFNFNNELTNTTTQSAMYSFTAAPKYELIPQLLYVNLYGRYVLFNRTTNSDFFQMNSGITFTKNRWHVGANLDNVLNDDLFVQDFIFPTYSISQQQSVFGRFFKMGISYKFK